MYRLHVQEQKSSVCLNKTTATSSHLPHVWKVDQFCPLAVTVVSVWDKHNSVGTEGTGTERPISNKCDDHSV